MRYRATVEILRLVVALGLLAFARPAAAASPYKNGICPSIDIRNSAEQFQRLRGCSVIEGRLSIVLMEHTNTSTFENMSFPELREVIGYIKIYRVRGLQNFGDLFPNLAVVRGMSLFKDFSLIIYDNPNLQAIGLRSLARIERGSVRVERNDKLCYTNTVDWSKIVVTGANNIIKKNYDKRLCGLCPACYSDSNGPSLCWDERHCQKVCPPACGDRPCMKDGTCCNAACVGGCDGTSPHQCHVCKYYSFGYGMNRTCVEHCPPNTYALMKRCVTESECRDMPPMVDRALEISEGQESVRRYKTFENSCIHTCPSGFVEGGNPLTCNPCPIGGCLRTCPGGKIDSVAAAEQFRGCTHIKGSLEISLQTGLDDTITDLEASLDGIREIEGTLKVTRSPRLVSLSFLKSLKYIGGQEANGTKSNSLTQSLHIFRNPNLEMLWNWTTHGEIKIAKGVLFIHFNPKLCYSRLEPLKNMTRDKASTFTETEVSSDNNGDQVSCLQEPLQLQVTEIQRKFVLLRWDAYCVPDHRKLLGYSIYYITTEHNITQYESRDACDDAWRVIDKPVDEFTNISTTPDTNLTSFGNQCKNKQPMFHLLNLLQPYTRYAVYIKTYTTLQDRQGAQSPIIYFKTLPGQPSEPQNLQVDLQTPHSVQVRWSAPTVPNGVIDSYRIQVQANVYNRPYIIQINYCANPTTFMTRIAVIGKTEVYEKKKQDTSKSWTGDVKDENCVCKDNKSEGTRTRFTLKEEAEQSESINFENALMNSIFEKRRGTNQTSSRIKRSLDNMTTLVMLSNHTVPKLAIEQANVNDEAGFLWTMFMNTTADVRSLRIINLRHFTWYTVSVWACRKIENESIEEYNKTWCSERAYQNFHTLDIPNRDAVSNVSAHHIASNKTLTDVNVTWLPPKEPNGFVVAYNVFHARADDSVQVQGLQSCVSVDDFENNGHTFTLRNLAPANYSIKVTPVTLRGTGNVSDPVYVFIPDPASDNTYAWVWGTILAVLVVGVILAIAIWYLRRKLGPHPTEDSNKLFASVNPEYTSTVYVEDEWELPRENVKIVKELGQGSFGMVYEGLGKNIIKGDPETKCAIKTVNEHATKRERIEFLKEASVMKAFDTAHVVRLLGVVSRGQPTLVVMELMARGDLKSYLRSHRPDSDQPLRQPPTLPQIMQMAIEIADGMAYLSANRFVHRDLAARNCMVAGDFTVKVGDFGMTRDIYETDYYRKGSKGMLPVRWMSPESLKDGVFSSNSDVWSFGVVLWEMATLAMQPYQGLSNEQVLRYVVEGGVMKRPEQCPDRLYELMRACWAHRPTSRPSFLHLVADLQRDSAPYFRQRSFFHSQQGQEAYSQQINVLDEEEEEAELSQAEAGAAASGTGSNLFNVSVSGRLVSWMRDRSRGSVDAAAEPLAPHSRAMVLKHASPPANGVLRDATTPC